MILFQKIDHTSLVPLSIVFTMIEALEVKAYHCYFCVLKVHNRINVDVFNKIIAFIIKK